MRTLSSLFALVGASWRLLRADLILPREIDAALSPPARTLGRALRLLAGPTSRQGRPGERLALVLEGMGPAAIKLGQLLSTRADVFGQAFAADLSRLKDQLPPFPLEMARAEIATQLGRPIEALFRNLQPALAGASLAQVHKGQLADGRTVAIKVLRPGIETQVARDCDLLHLASTIVDALVPPARRLEPKAFAVIVARSLALELDLRLEAAGAAELGEIMALDPYMSAPSVVWDGVARRMLTLEWASGIALSSPAALDQDGLDRKTLADNLTRGFLCQALDHGVFHADLHEGNLFVAAPARLVAVDFGIMGRLGPAERRYLAEILFGFITRDYARVARLHFEAGYVPAHYDQATFAQALRAVGEPIFGRSAKDVSMARLLTQLFEITALFEMRLRPELVLLQKTMVIVEGVARRIDPEHNIWAAADPVVRRWIARELSPTVKAREFASEALKALQALSRMADPPPAPVAPSPALSPLVWLAAGAGIAGAAFLLAALIR